MPSLRALAAAVVPGLIVFAVFFFWLGLPAPIALAAGFIWAGASLVVTRVLYDDHEAELAAWREAAPDLAAPLDADGSHD
jgi:multisubunit Na+/H+ antiporter MnhB subunit